MRQDKWVVLVDNSDMPGLFPSDYFPREFAYKKDANERAEEARQAGYKNVQVVRGTRAKFMTSRK